MHPKGKVLYNEQHAADRRRARMLHAVALGSAAIVTALLIVF